MTACCVWNAANAAGGGGSGAVTLSGDTNSAFRFGADCYAYHYANSDGTFDEKDNTSSAIQINASTDWIIPNGDAPGTYRVKYSNMTGDTGSYVGSISTVYAALTSSRYTAVVDTSVFAGGKSITKTLHIDDVTTEKDTGSYTLTADREYL